MKGSSPILARSKRQGCSTSLVYIHDKTNLGLFIYFSIYLCRTSMYSCICRIYCFLLTHIFDCPVDIQRPFTFSAAHIFKTLLILGYRHIDWTFQGGHMGSNESHMDRSYIASILLLLHCNDKMHTQCVVTFYTLFLYILINLYLIHKNRVLTYLKMS